MADHVGSLPSLIKNQLPIPIPAGSWRGNACASMALRHGNQCARTNEDAFRVDIEVYSYKPMRTGVPSAYRSAPGQPMRGCQGNRGRGSMRVRRLRMSVHALSPLLLRQKRLWRHSDTTNSSSGYSVFSHRHKLNFNRVVRLTPFSAK